MAREWEREFSFIYILKSNPNDKYLPQDKKKTKKKKKKRNFWLNWSSENWVFSVIFLVFGILRITINCERWTEKKNRDKV